MEHQSIQLVVKSMLQQYERYGASKRTIENCRKGFCRPIIQYFVSRDSERYSSDILDQYLDMFKEKYEKGIIGSNYYSTVTRVVKLLKSVGDTGIADFSRAPVVRIYEPSSIHLQMVDEIIEINKVAKGSVKTISSKIRHIFCFMEQNQIKDEDVTDELFYRFIESVSNSNKGSMIEIMRAVSLTSEYLKSNGSLKLRTDFSLLPAKRSTIHMIPPYSQEEIKKIIEAIDLSTSIGKRDYAIIMLAFDTGLRGCDIVKLKLKDIDWENQTLTIIQKKTGFQIIQALKGIVLNALADYVLEARPDNGEKEVFLSAAIPYKALSGSFSLNVIIEKYCRLAGVEKKARRSFHSIRRAFATELSLNGVRVDEIAEMLGHRQIRSSKPYLSYDRRQISFVAADFSEIPLTKGIYSKSRIHNVEE